MSFRGMDPDHVERVAQHLALQAELVAGVVGVVDTAIAALIQVWMGEDVAAFHALWSATHRPAARSTAEDLGSWATVLRAQALAQQVTSQGGGVSASLLASASKAPSASSRTWVSNLAKLTDYAEGHTKHLPPGFTRVPQKDLPPEHRPDGFDYEVFQDKATGRYIVVYPGTKQLKDWGTDIRDGLGYSSRQYEEATKLAVELNAKYHGQVTFTGHSLGGGLAIVSSLATGKQAITFNSSSPQGKDLDLAAMVGPPGARDGSNITNYVTPDDPLRPDRLLGIPGKTVHLESTDGLSWATREHDVLTSGDPLGQIPIEMWHNVGHDHGMDHIEREIERDDSNYWTEQ